MYETCGKPGGDRDGAQRFRRLIERRGRVPVEVAQFRAVLREFENARTALAGGNPRDEFVKRTG